MEYTMATLLRKCERRGLIGRSVYGRHVQYAEVRYATVHAHTVGTIWSIRDIADQKERPIISPKGAMENKAMKKATAKKALIAAMILITLTGICASFLVIGPRINSIEMTDTAHTFGYWAKAYNHTMGEPPIKTVTIPIESNGQYQTTFYIWLAGCVNSPDKFTIENYSAFMKEAK